jgi:molybdate transport system ATP-binding protein
LENAILKITNLSFGYQQNSVLKDFSWQINAGENWMIKGISGSGKTTLAKIISNEISNYEGSLEINFSEKKSLPKQVIYVPNWFQFTSLDGQQNFYYQQRYNKIEQNDTLTVLAELKRFEKKENLTFEKVETLLNIFGFDNFKNQQLIELSSGEHKKLQLIKVLWLQPQLLIIDQPYTGLDIETRKKLNQYIDELTTKGVTFILINNDNDNPDSIKHFAEIKDGKLNEISLSDYTIKNVKRESKPLPYFLQTNQQSSSESMIQMKNVEVIYGTKKVLENIDWEVKSGEKWLVYGANGSGKSTLLSLINGDHPQAYGNDISLFGNKRGSGESIWEIKEKIGMISPELHWYFDMNTNVKQAIASGFFDSMSLYQKLDFEQQQKLEQLLYFFNLQEDQSKKLKTLPIGQQRLVLLARTLVKNPKLLVLDEPCQGLDNEQIHHFNQIIDDLAASGQTLIYVAHFHSQIPNCISHQLHLEKGRIINKTNKTN